jgi:hypothetical protein
MDIRFVSSLTPEDESRLAAAILSAARALLQQFELPYTIRIETSDGRLMHHCNAPVAAAAPLAAIVGAPSAIANAVTATAPLGVASLATLTLPSDSPAAN